jgi:hypothetical protein
MTDSAADILRPITTGDLRGWRGLPGDLSLARLLSAFPRDSGWSGAAQLGTLHREASYLWVDIPGPERKMRVWFDDERVLLLDVACSWLQVRPDQLTGLFAEPPVALDTWQGTLPMPGSELVFPGHGIAAFVNREMATIWHLALFRPVALEVYEDKLRIDMQARRHPPLRG